MAMLFTSDLHLGHNNVLPSRQQFQDINEHDDTLIFKWNNKVKNNDDVYILGDLSFRSPHHISYYLSRMKGRKHLIIGNHDWYWIRHVEHIQPHALNAGVDINGFEPVTFENLKENNNRWYERG